MNHTIIDKNGKPCGTIKIHDEAHHALNSQFRTLVPGEAPSADHTWDGTKWNDPTAADLLARAKTNKLNELAGSRHDADTAAATETDATMKTALSGTHQGLHEHLKSVVASATTVAEVNSLRWTPAEHIRKAITAAQVPPTTPFKT